MLKILKYSAILPFLLSANLGIARGEFLFDLSVEIHEQSSGVFRYDYTLRVDSASDLSAILFGLEVPAGTDIVPISGPPDWVFEVDDSAAQQGIRQVGWGTSDPDGGSDWISPGSAAHFSLSSRHAPDRRSYLLGGAGTGHAPQFGDGQVLAPGASAVPEPPSITLLGLSLGGLLLVYGVARLGRRVRRRPSQELTNLL